MIKGVKSFLFGLLALLLALCTMSCADEIKEDVEVEPSRKDVLLDYAVFQDYKMTEEEVKNSLMDFLLMGNESKGLDASSFSIKKIDGGAVHLDSNCASKALASAEQDDIIFSVYEVENRAEDKSGFAITSDDRRIGEVLCYIENGEFQTDISDKPAMIIFASCLEDYVNETQEIWNSITDEEIEEIKKEYGLTDEDIERLKQEYENTKATYSYGNWYISHGSKTKTLITTKWDQDGLYNDAVESVYGYNYLTGCVATATAQLMAYWEYPKKHTSPNLSLLKSKWSAIKNWDGTYDWVSMKNGKVNNQIGALMFDIGLQVGMKYDMKKGSSAKIPDAVKYLGSLGYFQNVRSGGSEGVFEAVITNEGSNKIPESIDNNRPVLIGGFAKEITTKHGWWIFSYNTYSYDEGHAWLIDGYYKQTRSVTKTILWIFNKKYTESEMYVHCNYGWGGADDGWYKYGLFNTKDYNFRYLFETYCNIHPSK